MDNDDLPHVVSEITAEERAYLRAHGNGVAPEVWLSIRRGHLLGLLDALDQAEQRAAQAESAAAHERGEQEDLQGHYDALLRSVYELEVEKNRVHLSWTEMTHRADQAGAACAAMREALQRLIDATVAGTPDELCSCCICCDVLDEDYRHFTLADHEPNCPIVLAAAALATDIGRRELERRRRLERVEAAALAFRVAGAADLHAEDAVAVAERYRSAREALYAALDATLQDELNDAALDAAGEGGQL